MKQLAMEGICAFSLDLGNVNLRVGRISNNRAEGVSGTLTVRLWALESPFGGGRLQGHVVGNAKLSPLEGGSSIRDFDVTVAAESIPSGYYYPAMTLEEYDPSSPNDWYIMDIYSFSEPVFFGNRLVARNMRVTPQSSCTADVSVEEIRNETREPTHRLRVTVWATREPYLGGAIRGFRLGSQELDPLAGGESYSDLAWTFERKPGTKEAQRAVLLLEEQQTDKRGGWQLRDYCSADLIALDAGGPSAGDVPAAHAEPEIKAEDLIGQARAKAALSQVIALARVNEERRRRGLAAPKVTLHAVFKGSPGTGKTTFARFYAQQIHSLGLLKRGHLIEVSRSDLVAEYQGQTAPKTAKAVESALGGMLFIDEAYALKQGKDDRYGQECIDTIVKKMEDHRDELVVIFAGYSMEMEKFLRQNTGLASRVPHVVEFDDFDDSELGAILDVFCRRAGVLLAPHLRNYAVEMVAQRRRGRSFGNARDVRNLFERALAQQSVRLARLDLAEVSPEDLSRLQYSDLTPDPEDDAPEPPERKGEGVALEQLLGLVGLSNVKRDMQEIAGLIRVERLRHPGRGLLTVGLHRVYAGAPGMGKRTVARLFASFLHEIGLLARGHLLEVSRADLVAGYLGQTALKTRERVEEAMGGVLYLADAPALWQHKEKYETDAIETLMDAAENHRNRLVMILAGDTDEVRRLFEENPRLQSLFGAPLQFGGLSNDDLLEIGRRMAETRSYSLTDAACAELRAQLEARRAGSAPFGNAREVQALLEHAYRRHALRLVELGDPANLPPHVLNTLQPEDFTLQDA